MFVIAIDTWLQDDCTIGRLSCEGFRCFTLELPWDKNKKNVSCIPEGHYTAAKYDSPKHGPVLLFDEVPGRDFIEIHAGNYTRQIQGCLLLGDTIKYLDGDTIPDVTNSRATIQALLRIIPDEVKICIQRSSKKPEII